MVGHFQVQLWDHKAQAVAATIMSSEAVIGNNSSNLNTASKALKLFSVRKTKLLVCLMDKTLDKTLDNTQHTNRKPLQLLPINNSNVEFLNLPMLWA